MSNETFDAHLARQNRSFVATFAIASIVATGAFNWMTGFAGLSIAFGIIVAGWVAMLREHFHRHERLRQLASDFRRLNGSE